MGRVSKDLYDNIDVANLFKTWHPHVKAYRENLNQDSVLQFIKKTEHSSFDTTRYGEVQNFTNTNKCKSILSRVLREKNIDNFFNLLKERDSIHPRRIDRGFTVEEIYKSVLVNNYHPIFLLELNKKPYIIDGRTRLYCCLFLNVPAKVRILTDQELNESCK